MEDAVGPCVKSPQGKHYLAKLSLIDFGGSVDAYAASHLYGIEGPSRGEQTVTRTAPEAWDPTWFTKTKNLMYLKYDMWTVGLVILELHFGTPRVDGDIRACLQYFYDQHECHMLVFDELLMSGNPDSRALNLARDLLKWNPNERLSVDEALRRAENWNLSQENHGSESDH